MKQPASVKVKVPRKKPEPLAPFPEHGHVCLNCGYELSNNFCSICGQSTGTHRLSIMHFMLHDLVHSLWHIDRGVFFTLKEVLVRPGYAAIDYIRGKRAGRFPILTLLLLLIGATLWLYAFHAPPEPAIRVNSDQEFVKQFFEFFKHNKKWVLLGLLPIGALSTNIVFRRTRLNFTEHLVVNSYVFGGVLVVLLIIRLIMLALPFTKDFLDNYKDTICFLFYVMGYWQAYHKVYRTTGLIWRYFVVMMLDGLFLSMAMISLMGVMVVAYPESGKSGHHLFEHVADSVRNH